MKKIFYAIMSRTGMSRTDILDVVIAILATALTVAGWLFCWAGGCK